MGFRIECWGDYACFTRPELKTERFSYEVMTPSAARGIVEAIFWHPGLRYVIDKIYVLKPIKFTNIRRNEIKEKISADNILKLKKDTNFNRIQRAATVLKDVRYCIEFHFDMTSSANETDNPDKFTAIITKRARNGMCFHQPYFGCREFPVDFRLMEDDEKIEPIDVSKDLGFMLWDMDYSNTENIVPRFFKAELKNGVLDLEGCEVYS